MQDNKRLSGTAEWRPPLHSPTALLSSARSYRATGFGCNVFNMELVIRDAFLATFASYFDRDAGISHKIYYNLSKKLLRVDRTECQQLGSRLEDTRTSASQIVKKRSTVFLAPCTYFSGSKSDAA